MEKYKDKNLIFLDIDGVFNCELFYKERYSHLHKFDGIPLYKVVKKLLRKLVKKNEISELEYCKNQICTDRVKWFSSMCNESNAVVVISSTWRSGREIDELQNIFDYCGGEFKIIGKTPHSDLRVRGAEIKKWLKDNCKNHFGVEYFDFYRYAIIDDDSDMLLEQQDHYFQTDNYSGLTPNTCYKIKRFFLHKTF